MLQQFIGARRRAMSPLFTHSLALLALAAGFVAAVPAASRGTHASRDRRLSPVA